MSQKHTENYFDLPFDLNATSRVVVYRELGDDILTYHYNLFSSGQTHSHRGMFTSSFSNLVRSIIHPTTLFPHYPNKSELVYLVTAAFPALRLTADFVKAENTEALSPLEWEILMDNLPEEYN